MADAAAPTDPARPCTHEDFHANVTVARVEPHPVGGMPKAFVADIHVNCADCGAPFTFVGVPCGLSYDQPRCSVDGTELRAPIRPLGAADGPSGMPGFGISFAGRNPS